MYRTVPLGRTGTISAAASAAGGRNVFELERHQIDAPGEIADRVQVVIGRADFAVGHLAGRRVVVGRKRVDAIAHPASGNGEHPAQLPAAQHADRRARQNRLRHGSVSPSTRSVCSRRNCFSLFAPAPAATGPAR